MGQYGQNVLVVTGSRVGIGTATPSTTLHVSAGDSSRALFGPNATWGAYLYVGASPNVTSNTVAQVISTNGNLHLDSGTSQNTYINGYSQTSTFINPEGGSVSIGTYDAPGARLQVNTTSDVVAIFKRTSNGASGIQFTNAGSNYSTLYGGYDSYALRYFYNTSEYLTMDTSGNLGIGITSPATKLDVNGGIKATTIQLTSGAASGYVLTSDSTGNGSWQAASGGGGGGIHILTKPVTNLKYGQFITGVQSYTYGNGGTNLIILAPFIPANNIRIQDLSIEVAQSFSGGLVQILVYSADANGLPDTKLIQSTNLDVSTSGTKTYISNYTFTAGTTYWIGLHTNQSNVGVVSYDGSQIMSIDATNAFIPNTTRTTSAYTFGSAPTTISGTTTSFNNPFVVLLKSA